MLKINFRKTWLYRKIVLPILIFSLEFALAFFESIIPSWDIDEMEELIELYRGKHYRTPNKIFRLAKSMDESQLYCLKQYAEYILSTDDLPF